ncbi:MAG: TatD family hydrolase [Vulcanimicrobiota bacterium]
MWDCHCHLTQLDDLAPQLENARRQGIHGWLSCAYDRASWEAQKEISRLPGVMVAQGLHPWHAEQSLEGLEQHLAEAVAIGECGLDFYRARDPEPRERQRTVLRSQLELARRTGKPLVLHCVRAHQALLQEIEAYPEVRCMLHGFLGSSADAQAWLRRGDFLSLGPHALSRADLMRQLPLDRVLIETDAPSRGSSLLDLKRVLLAWQQVQPLQEDLFEANLYRFLGKRRPS